VLATNTNTAIQRSTTPRANPLPSRLRLAWLRVEPVAKIRSDLSRTREAAQAPFVRR
jgi:hypothetical protein